jgi:hypothetical protein
MADNFFRARLNQTIDLQNPLALLAKRFPWDAIEARIIPLHSLKNRSGYFNICLICWAFISSW